MTTPSARLAPASTSLFFAHTLVLLAACHLGSKGGDSGSDGGDGEGCTPDSYNPLGFGDVALVGDPDDEPTSRATVSAEIISQQGGCTVPGDAWSIYCYGWDEVGTQVDGEDIPPLGRVTVVGDLGLTLEALGASPVSCELVWQDMVYNTYTLQ